mmetsp:Transcript_4799/g.13830  ORF Transcript_4799/g.13830 Transcript_4799/m.13830 type:complete len:569 (-) Transcript_4799:140-1846(-)
MTCDQQQQKTSSQQKGKTTSSSAIATMISKLCGKRVLLVSTDPAHSLGDAWTMKFSNVPSSPISNLDVMEVDPKQTLEAELRHWMEYSQELFGEASDRESSTQDEFVSKIASFQEWLSGIPGIDEATALSSAIHHIESGKYDLIIFDTAPTGHTLKLLALPAILEQGIAKLQTWQSSLWGYWEAIKGFSLAAAGSSSAARASKRASARDQVTHKLAKYKESIQKVAAMLQDQNRTRFVVVCIAEFLSISETQRLLQELQKHNIRASHIIVNQLVIRDALSNEQLAELESLAELGSLRLQQELLQKTVNACRLTTSRKNVQQKYLRMLQECTETRQLRDCICEVPLVADEVTGAHAISNFSEMLITSTILREMKHKTDNAIDSSPNETLDNQGTKRRLETSAQTEEMKAFEVGDTVKISGLEKSPEFNGKDGRIVSPKDAETGRYGVAVAIGPTERNVALLPENLVFVSHAKKKARNEISNASADESPSNDDGTTSTSNASGNSTTNPMIEKVKSLLDDPEIKALVDSNPSFRAAIDDCLQNPVNAIKYFGNPEMGALISKVMSKLRTK